MLLWQVSSAKTARWTWTIVSLIAVRTAQHVLTLLTATPVTVYRSGQVCHFDHTCLLIALTCSHWCWHLYFTSFLARNAFASCCPICHDVRPSVRPFMMFCISRGSAATYLRCDELFSWVVINKNNTTASEAQSCECLAPAFYSAAMQSAVRAAV